MPNKLINETSPYLLQHAHNPVHWYPWGEEALQQARALDKPILVSIGYAACHWCHVMERESFENEDTAALMNEYFVNIKIDREERPDLDHIYMDALQAISGAGGWPLNVFLTPDCKPFFGGTYFPPVRAFNRSSWREVIHAVHESFRTKRGEVETQSQNLVAHLQNANRFTGGNAAGVIGTGSLQLMADGILHSADKEWGGFGRAPKFPQTFSIRYLLRHYHYTGNQEAVEQALLSLNKMIQGGIYDQAGGGFARYSTDTEWQAPHFEKMLYDNALLVSALSEAYQLTQDATYREVIEHTLAFVERELMSPAFAFYSALDADSEGVEGKFYTWQYTEIQDILGEEASLFCDLYQVTPEGNWHEGHTNILWMPRSVAAFAAEKQLNEEGLQEKRKEWHRRLMEMRGKRQRPLLDDKVLLGWNALMNTAYCDAFAATGNPHFRELALRNMAFLEQHFRTADGWKHSWKKEARIPAFLDDYAMLIQAYLRLQEVTGDTGFLEKAAALVKWLQLWFLDEESGLFFYTHHNQNDVVIRKKEVYDGATPSGNALMAANLAYLSVVYNKNEWYQQAQQMVGALGQTIVRYPGSFGCWALLIQQLAQGFREIAVVGPEHETLSNEVLQHYIPGKIFQQGKGAGENYPLLAGREGTNGETRIYLCKDYTCQAPFVSVNDLLIAL
ncbi:thioredoxin domain-containing protein [Filimonas effusa]|uniref:Thioredoxin domain-containing protein n=1 Tax=Filimonas effusa TaxID=2508721 RepID=A0A4Q1D1T1_9BACT|nr:thioredoxin domain-containing protein [Filimonas effusa]RXK81781.1 thioredoxin domain-containing protein [Filimonas effusa]